MKRKDVQELKWLQIVRSFYSAFQRFFALLFICKKIAVAKIHFSNFYPFTVKGLTTQLRTAILISFYLILSTLSNSHETELISAPPSLRVQSDKYPL